MYTGIILHILNKAAFVIGSYAMHFFLGRYLSEAQYGMVGTIITIINFEYIFFTDGVRQGMSRSISSLRYDEKHLIRVGLGFQLALIAVFFAGTCFGAPLIAGMLGDMDMVPYIRGVAFLLPFTGIYSLTLGILNGHKDFKAEAGIGMIYPVLKLSVIPFVMFVFHDAVFGMEAGFLFAGVLIMVISVIQVLKKRSAFYTFSEKIKVREYVLVAMNYLLLFCVSTVIMNLDTLILKSVSGNNTLVGYYTGVASFAKIPYFLLTAFYTVALPLITRHYEAGEIREASEEIGSLLDLILALILPAVTVISAAAGHVLALFYKPSYRAGGNALSLLIFGTSFLGMALVFAMILSAASRKKIIAWISAGMLVMEIILCPLLTSVLSLTGTALATFVTAGAGMLVSAYFTASVYGNFWQKKHTQVLLMNLAAYALFFVLFRYLQFANFFILVAVCGVCYLPVAAVNIWRTGLRLPGRSPRDGK
ncbi:MAG: oligosaccharide flippase family protein [Lachnospiraceae bacterium]|nr:oligosaccharide flippase family protein [Lachnospiraceae bacterium]MDY4068664.1 oligosaccharide flippase family protein [Lachnospiraceae bacterium]